MQCESCEALLSTNQQLRQKIERDQAQIKLLRELIKRMTEARRANPEAYNYSTSPESSVTDSTSGNEDGNGDVAEEISAAPEVQENPSEAAAGPVVLDAPTPVDTASSSKAQSGGPRKRAQQKRKHFKKCTKCASYIGGSRYHRVQHVVGHKIVKVVCSFNRCAEISDTLRAHERHLRTRHRLTSERRKMIVDDERKKLLKRAEAFEEEFFPEA